MDTLYAMDEAVAATGGRTENLRAGAICSVSIDSREIAAGALFVAIRGERHDGHDFVARAIEAGAAAALVAEARADEFGGLPLIVVPDPLEGLEGLARFARARSNARIVAVTGSVGKTSTKEAIRAVLAREGETHAAIRSFNNHWGVPLMLARMPQSARFGVYEIGMSAPGEIGPLSQMVRPHVAVVTMVAEAHLEFLGSLEAIADAKAEIFSGLEPGGVAILNRDHGQAERLVRAAREAGARIVTYGFDPQADAVLTPLARNAARLAGDGLDLELELEARGRHALANAAGAILAAREAGADPAAAAGVLARLPAPEGRGAVARLGDPGRPLVLLDESYNANPASMRAALDVFSGIEAPAGRRVLALGDMLELGETSEALHAGLAAAVLAARPDAVFLVGEKIEALAALLPSGLVKARGRTVEGIAEALVASLAPGDALMVKGSNGVRLGVLVATVRERFSQEGG